VIFVPYPDSGPPCTGGTNTGAACLYDQWGNALLNNSFTNNGGYGNPSNGDFAMTNFAPEPTDCLSGNTDTGGTFTTAPANAQSTYPTCNGQTVPVPPGSATFTTEVLCDSQVSTAACLPTDNYPRQTQVVMHPLPPANKLPTMANACQGVPANPWCSGHKGKPHHRGR
jgi:hypothetical protein